LIRMSDMWSGGDETGDTAPVGGEDHHQEEQDQSMEHNQSMEQNGEEAREGGGGEEAVVDGTEAVAAEEAEQEEEDNPFADDDDDEEDGVQVTIGEIRPNVQFSTKSDVRAAPAPKGAIDLDTVPVVDGVVLYDIDLAQSDDKPWRKPGADPSDYFNYGFTEDTWNMYCERQKKLRAEFGSNQHMVNRHIMAGISLSNPLGNAPSAHSAGNNRILVDNTRNFHFKPHGHNQHHRNDENMGGGSHTITRLGGAPTSISISTLGGSAAPDFSRPPPMMTTIPTMGGAQPDHSSTSVGSGEPAPPGAEDTPSTPTSTIPPISVINTSVPPPGASPMQPIQTLGGQMNMSMPPPGFNPAMPPPNLMGPPGGGMLPNTAMPPPGFNPMMPPPQHFGGPPGGPPMFGRAGYAGGGGMHGGMGRGMGRPPPLMRGGGGDHYGEMHRRDADYDRDRERRDRDRERDRERERERESSGEEDDRRHRRSERKKSRSPSKSSSSRSRRDDRSERRGEKEDRERSSRRHRSSSRDKRDSRKEKESSSKRSRGGADEERSEKKKRRHDKDEDREHTSSSSSSRSKRSKRTEETENTAPIKQEPIDTEGDE
ncbi:hypothetical protein PFISCL1PPCAC_9327, partial [Pristionchus fissidentatus]